MTGRPAAQYLRMSTDMQHLSLEMQKAANAAYAVAGDLEIVSTYEDPGLSGLTLAQRPGLKALLADALSGTAAFGTVLVSDVSRWGRFQDPDEAAHYEFLCRSAGVRVEYTAESFGNDASLGSILVKQLKRMMAAEFVRDHSEKIRRVHRHLNEHGYFGGGRQPYGYVRLQISADGTPQKLLGPAEKKSFVASRIVLTPGPPDAVAVVRRIFREYLRGRTTTQIVRDLNADGSARDRDRPWITGGIRYVLRNTLYVGDLVIGRETYVLGQRTRRPPETWVRRPHTVPPIIPRATWNKAQALLAKGGRSRHISDQTLLEDLHRIHRRLGHLRLQAIQEEGRFPPGLYKARFGSVTNAYLAAGLKPWKVRRARSRESYLRKPRAYTHEELLTSLRAAYLREGRLTTRIINEDPACSFSRTLQTHFGGLRLVYALVGYEPSAYQELMMEVRGQAITREEAAGIRRRIAAGTPVGELLAAGVGVSRRADPPQAPSGPALSSSTSRARVRPVTSRRPSASTNPA